MLEIPEAHVIAAQIGENLAGKKIKEVLKGNTVHKMAWFSASPEEYHAQLAGKRITGALSRGGLIEIELEDYRLLAGDGANLTYLDARAPLPARYLLLINFNDDSKLYMTVQMYGGLWCYGEGGFPKDHYMAGSYSCPSPLTHDFNREYFYRLITGEKIKKKSVKAALATEQRIPGLGNGVLQDILFNARIHPKRKIMTLSEKERSALFDSLKSTLKEMTDKGGRDTEKDLLGEKGKYKTILSKNTLTSPCPVCSGTLQKRAYMGGSIYFCPCCQKEKV